MLNLSDPSVIGREEGRKGGREEGRVCACGVAAISADFDKF
jgi:hypothetical protein